MNRLTSFFSALAVIGCLVLWPHWADAQAPTGRVLRLVVPNPPGGPADLVARLLADQIGRARGPAAVVENRPGAGSDIGTEAVSRAAPDGNTLLLTNNNLVITKHIRPALAFDPMTSFEPMCMLATLPLVVVVNSASPYKTLSDLLAAARANPGTLTVGAFGPASSPHIAEESLKHAAKVDWTYVPFPGDAPAVTALLGGHVTALVATYAGVMEQLSSGKLRALATTGRERIGAMPNLPAIAEYGGGSNPQSDYKDFDISGWLALLAPARTPRDQIDYLTGLFLSALQTPELNAKLVAQGLYPDTTCGAAFAQRLRRDYEYYGRVIRDARIAG
jgi:tripartite-type tricarboxylate transporter receptor subunit TctC